MAKRPSRIDLLELDIDIRLHQLWRQLVDRFFDLGLPESALKLGGAFIRGAYGQAYCDVLQGRTIDTVPSASHIHRQLNSYWVDLYDPEVRAQHPLSTLEIIADFMGISYMQAVDDFLAEDEPGELCRDNGYEVPGPEPLEVRGITTAEVAPL